MSGSYASYNQDSFTDYGTTEPVKQRVKEGLDVILDHPITALSRSKRVLALLHILGCLFLPVVVHALVFNLQSFTAHRNNEKSVHLLCFVIMGISFLFFVEFWRLWFRRHELARASWCCFLFVTVSTGLFSAWILGNYNFECNMQPYYDLSLLSDYPAVDPGTYDGIQLMDAGCVTFTTGARIDVTRSMGFKNIDTYCVAPLVSPGSHNNTKSDLWVVGMNCCSGQAPDFECGDVGNPNAATGGRPQGLRVVTEEQRSFYRLAVQQAEAAYNLKAKNPVFFYWVSDAKSELNLYKEDGNKYFNLSVFCFFLSNMLLLILTSILVAKIQS